MDRKAEHEKICHMIQNALIIMCKNSLHYKMGFMLEGIVRVISDTEQPFTIQINSSVGEVSHINKDHSEITLYSTGHASKEAKIARNWEEGETNFELLSYTSIIVRQRFFNFLLLKLA